MLLIAAIKLEAGWLLWLFLLWPFVCSLLLYRVRCPECDTPLGFQGRLLGVPMYAAWTYHNCRSCGCDLTVRR